MVLKPEKDRKIIVQESCDVFRKHVAPVDK